MSGIRVFLAGVLLLFLALIGTCIYAWLQLPALLTAYAGGYLTQFGVDRFTLAELSSSRGHITLRGVELEITSGGQQVTIRVDSSRLDYSWQSLLQGRLDNLDISQIHAVVQPDITHAPGPTEPVYLSKLLPHSLLEQVPADQLEVRSFQLHYKLSEAQTLVADGHLSVGTTIELYAEAALAGTVITATLATPSSGLPLLTNLTMTGTEGIFTQASAQLTKQPLQQWNWHVDASVNHQQLLNWLVALEAENLLPPGAIPPATSELAGNTTIEANLSHSDQLILAQDGAGAAQLPFTATATGNSNISGMEIKGLLSAATAALDWSIEASTDSLLLNINKSDVRGNIPASSLALTAANLEWLQWGNSIPFHWQNPQGLRLSRTPGNEYPLRSAGGSLSLGTQNSEIRLQNLDIESLLTPGASLFTRSTISSRVSVRLRQQALPQLELTLIQQGNSRQQEFELAVRDITESVTAELASALDVESGSGDHQLRIISQDLPWLTASLLPVWEKLGGQPVPLSLATGKLTLQSDLRSDGYAIKAWQQTSKLELTDLTGAWQDYLFEGMNLDAVWSGLQQPKTSTPITLAIKRLNLGVDVSELSAQFSLPGLTPLPQPAIVLEALSGNVFGGRVLLPAPTTWDFGATSNALLLRAENWQLGEIVALQTNQDISALGLLEGEIPLRLSDGRVTIGAGYLRALSPGGSIRYALDESSAALAASSPELRLALDLLEDFQYELLNSTVSLDETGALRLGLSLAGRNPAYENGRQVNFNINLEQNLDPLLQSLRLNDSLLKTLKGHFR